MLTGDISRNGPSAATPQTRVASAVELAVALHGGIVPDYDAAAFWWQVQDLDFYAFQAAAIMIRIAVERTGRPPVAICGELVSSRGFDV